MFISLPMSFIQGTDGSLNDFTQNEPNILITLTVKNGSYETEVDKMLKMLSYTGGTKDMVIEDMVHREKPAKYITFDQMIADGLPWYRHQHIMFGNDKIAIEIMAVYQKETKLEKTVKDYLLNSRIDY